MQGSSGGGMVYMGGGNAGGMVALGMVLGVVAGVGVVVYSIMDNNDRPAREPMATDIVDRSLDACFNAAQNPELYTVSLQKNLMDIWSKDLTNHTPDNQAQPLCEDAGLNQFVLPYNYDAGDTNHRGEYRVAGLVFTQSSGAQAFVVKPETRVRAPNSLDPQPDAPTGLGYVLKALNTMPETVHQVTLSDGTQVAAYLQRDGVTQNHGSSKYPSNDGEVWADEKQMTEILTHFTPVWPVKAHVRVDRPYELPVPGGM